MGDIAGNWTTILLCAVFIAWLVYMAYQARGMSKEQIYEQIKGWLLQAVIIAEQTYGGGTGKLKLSSVYSEFCKAMPWVAKAVTFELFSSFVDKVLAEMKGLLATNTAIAAVVEGKSDE